MSIFGIDSILKSLQGVIGKVYTTDKEKLQAQRALEELRQKPHLLQALMNLAAIKNNSIYSSGWRPLCGWACAFGLVYDYFIRGLLVALHIDVLQINTSGLITLLLALLGLGSMRSLEKLKGIAPPYRIPTPPKGMPDIPAPVDTSASRQNKTNP